MLLPFGMAFTTPNRTTTMTRFWLTLITVVLMFALPMLAPAEHRGVFGFVVSLFGMIAVAYLAYPSQPQGGILDGRDKVIHGLRTQVDALERALAAANKDAVRNLSVQTTTLTLGDDPRIEVVYGSALIGHNPKLTDYRNTQDEEVLTRWVREGRKTWANTALRTSEGGLYFLRDGAPVNLISNLEQ